MLLLCKLINGEELKFEISKPSFIIGRSAEADIVIPHEGMSRKHCRIENKNGQVYITDLESANGVLIDEKRIPANTATPVPEYLNLSFGAVQSLVIQNTEIGMGTIAPGKTTSVNKNKKDPTQSGIKSSLKKQHRTGKHDIGSKKTSSKENSKKQFMLLIATTLILGLVGYLYYQDQSAKNAPMTHEEIYE